MREIKVKAGASIGKLQIMECWVLENGKRIGSKYINVSHLKEKGVIKKANSFKKAEEFLNTKEGFKFYNETPHTPLF